MVSDNALSVRTSRDVFVVSPRHSGYQVASAECHEALTPRESSFASADEAALSRLEPRTVVIIKAPDMAGYALLHALRVSV